ncbi:flavodoxin domain-containing protein [Brumicola nitratireducens]|uniref:Flavodoxin/nitric oxide synthase n=1 Tax=Glaciecola nitratireducens (strain JCM 12485 / KCTC 12276 / FR1064) TaxID=1085623 RepID=G4QNK2_GLANF|nr:flavodoxin domain-containing protein [Glaciecola nitratireducens]AEP31806.1 flavodoxin/nitric oxide synthase [Glaciecola nitratireducens FR1064]
MHFDIMVGSVLGASEYVAEALLAAIKEAGHDGNCHFDPSISTLNKDNVLLICTSTHGAGDLPDNIESYAKSLENQDLQGVNAIIVGLGDSSYDTYCGAAMKMETLIVNQGATLLTEPLHIDVLNHPIPEDIAVDWFTAQLEKL